MINRVPGTHDLLDMRAYHAVLTMIRTRLQHAGFDEIMTPLIEYTELFQRSLGNETDVISKELYLVNSAHTPEAERGQLCLRPEATASIMRAYLTNNVTELPWNVFTVGPMFRHERPQKGRYRQFHQVSIESIGATSIRADARLLSILDIIIHEQFGLRAYALLLNFMGCSADRAAYLARLEPFLRENQQLLCSTCVRRIDTNMLRVFDCKEPGCQELFTRAPHIADNLCEGCAEEWSVLRTTLGVLGVSYLYRPLLVRGLDYYEKTVFEFVSTDLGAQNAFCGGGRYNQLATVIGGKKDLPSVGAAFGIERILLIAAEQVKQHIYDMPLVLLLPLSIAQQQLVLQIEQSLATVPYRVEPVLTGDSVKSMLRRADRRGAALAVLVGADEQAAGTVKIKNMKTGSETVVGQVDLLTWLQKS